MEWYHVCWPRLTAKRVEPVVSISWASYFLLCWFISRFLLLHVACLLSVCNCLFSDYVKMGGQLDKLTGNPPHVVYFNWSLLSVTWRIKYYYYCVQNSMPWDRIGRWTCDQQVAGSTPGYRITRQRPWVSRWPWSCDPIWRYRNLLISIVIEFNSDFHNKWVDTWRPGGLESRYSGVGRPVRRVFSRIRRFRLGYVICKVPL